MRRTVFLLTILTTLMAGIFTTSTAHAQEEFPPAGFELFLSQPGIDVYRKEYPGGNPDYVIVADLTRRISIDVLASKPVPAPGGVEATVAYFDRKSLQDYWQEYQSDNRRAYCVINGSFFNPDIDPSSLLFAMKMNGKWVTTGAYQDPSDQLRMLELLKEEVKIRPYNTGETPATAASQVIGGLAETADIPGADLIGRTFLGTADRDGNGSNETLLILGSKTTKPEDAVNVLRAFGANALMMMSAGDYAQIMCNGQPLVYAEGTIPQAIGLAYGDVKPYEFSEAGKSDWKVLIKGEATELSLVVKNRGLETWKPGEVALINLKNPYSETTGIPLEQEVPPNGTASFSWQTNQFNKSGLFLSQWTLAQNGEQMDSTPVNFNIVVLPQELGEKKSELEALIQTWIRDQRENLETLVLDWLGEKVKTGFDTICPFSTALPGITLASVVVLKRRKKLMSDKALPPES